MDGREPSVNMGPMVGQKSRCNALLTSMRRSASIVVSTKPSNNGVSADMAIVLAAL